MLVRNGVCIIWTSALPDTEHAGQELIREEKRQAVLDNSP